MRFTLLALVSLFSGQALGAPSQSQRSSLAPFSTFTNVTIFTPPTNYTSPGTLYARTVELDGGVLLATWENYSPEPPLVYFPIFQSVDGGETWHEISKITDQVNGWGLRYQPFLRLLEEPFANFPAGTILAAGNSIPEDLNYTQIDVYQSPDQGYTWHFVSRVASGGAAIPDDGIPAIWEPFILPYGDQMIVFYSDQRDPLYGQRLVHQTSLDLVTWGPVVPDVEYSTYTDRPGMTTVTQLPNGQYMMTYEFGGGPDWPAVEGDYEFPVYYRINNSPLNFNESTGYPIVANGVHPTSSPYITWSSVGGPQGSILVSCGTLSQIFINQELGAVDAWKIAPTPEGISYTRSLRVFNENQNHVLIIGAGQLPPATGNKVTVSVIDLEQTLAQAV